MITLTLLDPRLRQILLSRIAAVHPATHSNLIAPTPPYRDLALQQASLGQNSLFYGFFHRDWTRLQEPYLRSQHKPTDRNQSRQAIESIALHFQVTARTQWDTHNQHLHESQDDSQPYVRTDHREQGDQTYLRTTSHAPPAQSTRHYQRNPLSDRLEDSTKRLQHRPPHTQDIRTFSRPTEHPRDPNES
jgi:hypothetical protein